ncbi:MAG: hypothetical protein ACP5R5_12030, partial [Armatimonadota bacterium]
MKYVSVAIDAGPIDPLTYEIPDGLLGAVDVGSCVLIPLGGRQVVGYVIGPDDAPEASNIRPIICVLE